VLEFPRPASGGGSGAEPMLIERLLPEYDAVRVEHRVMPGARESVFEATRQADFLEAWRGSRGIRLLFGARSMAERAASAARGRPHVEPPAPEALRLSTLPDRGDWVLLGQDPPREIAFGVVGRFWAGETTWEQIDAGEFQSFDRPGLAKIACNFSLRPYGSAHTLVSYECRTRTTDEASRSGFMRYWRPLSPFIGVVLRAQLGVIAADLAIEH
jgi:hypothetical protein